LRGENDEEVFGYQVVVDEDDQVEDLDQRLLIGASTLGVDRVVELIHGLGGLAVASHVDREGFGIFGQLGFIPDNLELEALEVSKLADYESVRARHRQSRDYVLITSSDAHYLEDIGAVSTRALMAEPTFQELKLALAHSEGRRILE
jgi:PHP family Zn ribbon phosphoesterase